MKTTMTEMIEWLQAYEYEIPLELQVKAKELLEKEKEQIMKAYEDAHDMTYNSCESGCMGQMILEVSKEDYYKETYNQNK